MRSWPAVAAVLVAVSPAAAQDPWPAPDPAGVVTAAPPPVAMVAVPGGSFRAGQRIGALEDTVVYHRVAPFLLDATEVTVAAYAACVRAGRCTPAAAIVRWEGLPDAERARWSAACNRDRADRAEHPVNCVDWDQAAAFCAWQGKRLPTEAEWEWAARGGAAGTVFPWGTEPPEDRVCWSGAADGAGAPLAGTCPVGSHPRGGTPSGLQDLAGNVWEWTATRDTVFADSRGRGGTPAWIARGGGWRDTAPGRLAAAARAKDVPASRAADLGFRCARSR
jgi:formylglycine-generating enzyme required for sulfatase activity